MPRPPTTGLDVDQSWAFGPPAYEVFWFDLRQAHHNGTTWDSALDKPVPELVEPGHAEENGRNFDPSRDGQN